MIELGGLWSGKDKNGNSMMSGYLGNAKLLIFKNTFKDAKNQPDYRLFVTKKELKDEANGKAYREKTPAPVADENADIPF